MKKSILIYFFVLLGFKGFCQTGTIRGVVTYYFNSNFGYKPDIGAKISILPHHQVSPFFEQINYCGDITKLTEDHNNYKMAFKLRESEYTNMPFYASKGRLKPYREAYLKAKTLYNNSEVKIKEVNICLGKVYSQFQSNSNDFEKTIADGNGTFSFKLKPGEYVILVSSNQLIGKVIKKVTVLPDMELNFTHQFDNLVEYTLLK